MDNSKIGTRIRDLRLKLNLTQHELAKKLGYKSRSTINKIEMGINDIHPIKIYAFAEALNTSPEYLLGYTKNSTLNENLIEFVFKTGDRETIDLNDEDFIKAHDYVIDLKLGNK